MSHNQSVYQNYQSQSQTIQQRPRMLFKITVLGEGGVGKTALTVQFTMASFVETYDPTIEDCYRKQWTVDEQPCLLEVLDTAGQEEYTALRDQWIRDGEGFLVVYSVCSRDTFDRVEQIVKRVRRVKEEAATMGGAYGTYAYTPSSPTSPVGRISHIPIVIIGNKRDMANLRDVHTEEGANLARRLGCEFFETSAKHGYNVENAFKTAVRGIKVAKGIAPGQGGGPGGAGGPGGPGAGGAARRKQRRNKNCVIL